MHTRHSFSQTGTLTGDGLDLWGLVPVREQQYQPVVRDVPRDLPLKDRLLAAMATCHSLTIIEGEIAGDPLDVIMFQATNWVRHFFLLSAVSTLQT